MIRIIGGGLAGSEAAWQAASRGVPVTLHEMRPVRPTAVHQTDRLAELVCSNSFRGDKLDNAVGLLKEEMRRLGSLVMRAAEASRVPAGAALAVDRERFAEFVTRRGHRPSAHHHRSRRGDRRSPIPPTRPGDHRHRAADLGTRSRPTSRLLSGPTTCTSTTPSVRLCWPRRSIVPRCSASRAGIAVWGPTARRRDAVDPGMRREPSAGRSARSAESTTARATT